MDGYKTILAPTDFSERATAALLHARILAARFGASIHLLHVLEDPVRGIGLEEGYTLPDDYLTRAREHTHQRLEKILTEEEGQSHSAVLAIKEGSPFVEIVRYAREQNVDLIVMGTHGRRLLAHMLLGSVAEQVLRKAPCPVLVVRALHTELRMP